MTIAKRNLRITFIYSACAYLILRWVCGCSCFAYQHTNGVQKSDCIVTNVFEWYNGEGCEICVMLSKSPGIATHRPLHAGSQYQPATERWQASNVVRRVTITVQDAGPRVFTYEVPISSHTNHWKLENEWRKQP